MCSLDERLKTRGGKTRGSVRMLVVVVVVVVKTALKQTSEGKADVNVAV